MFRRKSILPASGYDVTSSINPHLDQPARGLKPMAGTMAPTKTQPHGGNTWLKKCSLPPRHSYTQVTPPVDSASSKHHRRKPVEYYRCLSFLHGQPCDVLYSPNASIRQVQTHAQRIPLSAAQSHYIVSVLRLVQFNMVNYYQSVRLHVAAVRA
jgi:hypothetical protein